MHVFIFASLKTQCFASTYFCKWQVFKNFVSTYFLPVASFWKFWVCKFYPPPKKNKKKTVESRDIWLTCLSRSTGRQAGHNGKTRVTECELINIFCAYIFLYVHFCEIWILCIFFLYLFSWMPFKRKFCVHLI